ncbi:MAG: rhomboid family intramembrane serine protease [Chthoniobacterales bacterium]
MLDLNRILLTLALLSPIVVLVRTAPRAALNRGWQIAAIIVLVITALAWFVFPQTAGYVGGVAWLLLLFLPAVGLRKEAELVVAERYGTARRVVSILRWLHPVATVRHELLFLNAMEAAQRGEIEKAAELLANLRSANDRAGLQVIAQNYRIRGDWAGLLRWCRESLPLDTLGGEPVVLPLYFRALGETGALDDLVHQVAGRAPRLLASPHHQGTFDASVLAMLAFTGRTKAVAHLLNTRFAAAPAESNEFWIGTAELAAGLTRAAHTRLATLQQKTSNALLRADVAARLRPGMDPRAHLTPTTETTVARFEKNLATRRRSTLAPESSLPTPVVGTIIVLNLLMFLLEWIVGSTTDSSNLLRLGALQPIAVLIQGEYWRLLTALFLHYGFAHLLVNLYALYVLGPNLESAIGSLRFAACYLIAGLGSGAGVLTLWRYGWTQSNLLVGASGAVMGVVGAWAGLLIWNHTLPMARRRLVTIAAIVLIQTTFDFFTPQVSMAAHLCGFLAGLWIGLLLAPAKEAW